jgi:inhibitor of KinA
LRRPATEIGVKRVQFVPLGDQAALAYCGDEVNALRFAAAVRRAAPPWLVDVVQAYTSVAVFFDLEQCPFTAVVRWLLGLDAEAVPPGAAAGPLYHIPCCYELQQDMDRVWEQTGLNAEEVIARHTASEYTVYAIGFCPGFPYLGYLPPALAGVPRLTSPRPRVEAGSVGLTGRQTGIYTEVRPGGWNLIGRTPLELVNVADSYFPLRTGDRVHFTRIDEAEFGRLRGERLVSSSRPA